MPIPPLLRGIFAPCSFNEQTRYQLTKLNNYATIISLSIRCSGSRLPIVKPAGVFSALYLTIFIPWLGKIFTDGYKTTQALISYFSIRMKTTLCLLLLIITDHFALAGIAVAPGRDDTVNYTHILFELPYNKDAHIYEVRVYPSGKGPVITGESINNAVLIQSGLAFNTAYRWTYSYYDKNANEIFTSEPTHLYISGTWHGDTTLYRNIVAVNKPGEYEGGCISLDDGLIIDRNGRVVWTFPPGKFGAVRCLNPTKAGTVTFLWNSFCYEIDLRGNILWKSPDSVPGYKLPDYHHEFRKLDNGNYLCVSRRVKAGEADDIPYSIVFEIGRDNKVKWLWDEKEHYAHGSNFHGSHINAAFYDERDNKLYLSHRDLSSIAKIDVATGRIEYSIGYDYGNNIPYYPNAWFRRQHAITLDAKGNLLFFNNNSPAKKNQSSVMRIAQPGGKRPPEVIWEYMFAFTDAGYNYASKVGGVVPMYNDNVLVCLGANNRVVEVNKNKEIVWQADAEKYDSFSAGFIPVSGYRAAFASSLYPVYFVAHIEGRNLVIENTGTIADTYTCRFTLSTGRQGAAVKTAKPGKKVKIPVPAGAGLIEIISGRNDALSKTIVL